MNITTHQPIQRAINGFILPVLLFTVTFIISLITIVTSLSLNSYNLATRESYKVNAQMSADAGLDYGLEQLTINNSYSGTAGEVTLSNISNVKTTYQVSVLAGVTSSDKIIRAIGRTYSPATAATAKITRKYEVDIKAVTSGTGPSSVVTGVGGLILNNNAKISGGDIVVNGRITMGNNAQIGLSNNSVNVRVAHTNCPNPVTASYPRVCASGENGQPITLGGNALIYGDVRATNQTTGTNMFNPGLVPNQTVPAIPLPTYNRAAHQAAVAQTLASSSSTIDCNNNESKSWPANVKIIGDVTLGNNCTVTINGNVWATGSITLGNNARIVISNALGATLPTIMVDGGNAADTGGFKFGNNAQIVPNSSGTGAQIITFWSAGSCSPECSTVTGTDLANSQNALTIDLSNNGSAPNTILWARWSKVAVANNGAIGAVTGQTVELGNNAIINFTASIPGSSNLITAWVKRGYFRVFD